MSKQVENDNIHVHVLCNLLPKSYHCSQHLFIAQVCKI